MKKLNLITLLLLCCLFLSCKLETEKTQSTIFYKSNINNQNYKFDDDEVLKNNTDDSLKKAQLRQENLKKTSVKK